MAYMNDNYTPNHEGRAILDAAWAIIQTVPYQVTTRWIFYQLFQAGFYKDKKVGYKNCIALLSRARHNFYMNWKPDTLVDDRREAVIRAKGFEDVTQWVETMSSGGLSCSLDHFYQQDVYLEIWFEAEAMSRQFEYYTSNINLRPFSGMPSIGYKWAIAKDLESRSKRYDKPIVILYFGDYDQAGMTIPETSINDIREWCDVGFDVDRCGLNAGDAQKYHIPENIDKANTYQWVALGDDIARELITSSVAKYIDTEKARRATIDGNRAGRLFDDYVGGFADYYAMHQN